MLCKYNYMENMYISMKNNNLCKSKLPILNLVNSKESLKVLGLMAGLFTCFEGHAQFTNNSDVRVTDKTILSIYMDYQNNPTGKFINDGEVYIHQNWKNDGMVDFSSVGSNGTTYFEGLADQYIEGTVQSNFQNVVFNNSSDVIPFYLGTKISVNNKAKFLQGIINGTALDGLVIFNENALHEQVRDESFVDGKVQKIGKADFQFPVGADQFFRPSYHAAIAVNNIYTTQYFHKNSGDLHSHSNKEESIIAINDQEYWEVKQDQGAEKIVLSLSLDHDTTPSEYFAETATTKLAIVRWDETAGKWINEGGVLSEDISGEAYSNLITGQVSGYGLFTVALVKAVVEPDELMVYNAISPNDDGINDAFHIKGIDAYPDNTLEIYNRWGVKVYDANSYNESDNMFRGYSDGRVTIKRGDKLPTGTYFYILKYNQKGTGRQKAGYLYINNQ